MNRCLCIIGLLLFLGINAAAAQEADRDGSANSPAEPKVQPRQQAPLQKMPPGFKNQAVVLEIDARVIEQGTLEIWNESHQRVTIPGRPVGIKMVGANIVVDLQFVPYLRRGRNILVAQGQIWIDVPNQGIRYQTTMQTIPLKFGEQVYFFPLGSSTQTDEARIEIMLTMRRYKDTEKSESNTTEKPADSAARENSQ